MGDRHSAASGHPRQGTPVVEEVGLPARQPQRLIMPLTGTVVLVMLAGTALSLAATAVSGDWRLLLTHQSLVPISTVAYVALGALILRRHNRHPIGWVFLVTAMFYALSALSVGAGLWAGQRSLPAMTEPATWLARWVWIPGIALPTTLGLLWFPDGRPLSGRWGSLAWLSVAAMAGVCMGVMLHPGQIASWGIDPPNPYGLSGQGDWLGIVVDVSGLLLVLGIVGSMASLVVRYRRSHGVERQQLKWVALAGIGLLVSLILVGAISTLLPEQVAQELGIVINNLGIVGISVGVALAILRYRLYEIDLIIHRTLVYATLSALIAGLYGLAVGLGSLLTQSDPALAGSLLVVTVLAMGHRPLVDWLGAVVGRVVPLPDESFPANRAALRRDGNSDEAVSPAPAWLRRLWPPTALVGILVTLAALPGYTSLIGQGPLDMTGVPAGDPTVLLFDVLKTLASLSVVAVSIGLAYLLYRQRSAERMPLLVSYFLLIYGVCVGGPLEVLVNWLGGSIELALTLVVIIGAWPTLIVFFQFPDGVWYPRWSRWLSGVAFFFGPVLVTLSRPLDRADLGWYEYAGGAVWFVAVLALVGGQIVRFRQHSNRLQRRQTKLVVVGLIAWILILAAMTVPYVQRQQLPAGAPIPWWALTSELAWFLGMNVMPIALTVAVLRDRLYRIDLILNRALVYGALSLLIAGVYVLTVGALGIVFQSRGSLVVALLATGLAAVAFQPLRQRLQTGVNRLLYGDRDDPYVVLTGLSHRLESVLATESVLPTLVETVAQTLKLPYVAVSLRQGNDLELVSEYGKPTGSELQLPLVYQGEEIGQLRCATRGPNDPFNEGEQQLLRDVAAHAGAAVHAVRLTDDLQRSRERLLLAREEERRRLRRDLHDGLGPELASMSMKLEAARNLLRKEPDRADELLAGLTGQVKGSLADVRRLVYGLRPPALDEFGLVAAVRERAIAHNDAGGLLVSVKETGPIPHLPAAVEVAAYRIALEALTNVIRHAEAAHCWIQFRANGDLQVEVTDDGRGLPSHPRPGVGLHSMRERATELGGDLVVERRSSGGTRLLARLPLTLVEVDRG